MTNFSANRSFIVCCIAFLFLSGCSSAPPRAVPPVANIRVAIMPMENLSGTAVPLKEMMRSLREALKSKGLGVLEEDILENFMEKHRVRYAGGLTQALGEAFLEETGTKAVLFLSIDQYDEPAPPKIAVTARMVSTGKKTAILWMDGVAMAGNDAPGILGIGRIDDPRVLWDKVKEKVAASLADLLAVSKPRDGRGLAAGSESHELETEKYLPKSFYRGGAKPVAGRDKLLIAVLPFFNDSTRRNAGEIMALHFVRRLSERDEFEVVDPGVVRQALLMSRTIMEGGLSLPQADLLHAMLGVDLVLTGIVFEYDDYSGPWGNPKVNFTARVYDMKTRQVDWASISYNRGDDWVVFFNQGKVNTAHAVASGMTRAVVETMAGREAEGSRGVGD